MLIERTGDLVRRSEISVSRRRLLRRAPYSASKHVVHAHVMRGCSTDDPGMKYAQKTMSRPAVVTSTTVRSLHEVVQSDLHIKGSNRYLVPFLSSLCVFLVLS